MLPSSLRTPSNNYNKTVLLRERKRPPMPHNCPGSVWWEGTPVLGWGTPCAGPVTELAGPRTGFWTGPVTGLGYPYKQDLGQDFG